MVSSAGGVWCHNFLEEEEKDKIESKRIGPGLRSFSLQSGITLVQGDLILKWSESGTHKTVWQITKLHSQRSVGIEKYQGEMKDVIFHDCFYAHFRQLVRSKDTTLTTLQ